MMRIIVGIVLVILLLAGLGWMWMAHASKGIDPAKLEAEYVGPNDRFVEVAGARVRVREEGPKDAPPIVLIHGFTFSLESWDHVAEFVSLDHRVIRYDLLGHGLTGPDKQKRYSIPARAEFLGALLDKLGIPKTAIAGNSLGGTIAWRYAAAHPERVSKLILMDAPVFPFNAVHDKPMLAPAALKAYLKLAPVSGLQKMAAINWSDSSRIQQRRLKQIQDMMKREGNGQAGIDHVAQFTMPDPAALLKKITAPVLIIWGADDRVIPVANGLKTKEALPGSAMMVIAGAGHVPQEEKPLDTAGAIADFLQEKAGE